MSTFKANCHHAYAQTDGTYKWPNSLEGDQLKQAFKEIGELQDAILATEAETKKQAAALMIERFRAMVKEYDDDNKTTRKELSNK